MPPKLVVMSGLPGTGKTEIAEALAAALDARLHVRLVPAKPQEASERRRERRSQRCIQKSSAAAPGRSPARSRRKVCSMAGCLPAGRVWAAGCQANPHALVGGTGDVIWSVNSDHELITFNAAFALGVEARTGFEPSAGDGPEDL